MSYDRSRNARSPSRLGACNLLCGVLFLPPYETAVTGGTPTVYLNFGQQIAHHGALEFEDALLSSLSTETRAELVSESGPRRHDRRFARFPGGFLIPDIAAPHCHRRAFPRCFRF